MPTRETWKRFTVNENLMAEMKEKLFVPERNIDSLPKLNAWMQPKPAWGGRAVVPKTVFGNQ
jgi:hypothetical protein